jgi:hypothetical protein
MRSGSWGLAIVFLSSMASAQQASPPRETPHAQRELEGVDSDGEWKYPGYVIAGAVNLVGGAALGVGAAFAAHGGHPKTALGLAGLGTVAWGVGVPFVLLGAADESALDPELVSAGAAIATPGALGIGLGATILSFRAAKPEETDLVAPLVIMGAGAATLVTGVVVWSLGAGHSDVEVNAKLHVSPGGVNLTGSF